MCFVLTDTELGLGLQTPESPPIRSYFQNIDTEDAETFRGAFAYVTYGGVKQLENGLPDSLDSTTPKWLVSFDYGYTQPEAVQRLNELGEVRVVGVDRLKERNTLNANPRFHPKFIWIQEDESNHLMMGSSNLTESALTRNWEAVVFLRSIDPDHSSIDRISSWWEEVWEESTPVSEDLLDWYKDLRESTNIGPDDGAEDHDEWEDAPHPRDASIVWANIGYTQSGSRNQMDIPTQFGQFFLEDDDEWELNSEYEITIRFEGETLEKKVKYHEGSYQTRIYLPTETRGTRLADLYSKDKFDEESLRYYFAVFRRIGQYKFRLEILPPEESGDIQEIIEVSQQREQVEETDEETERLVGWL